MNWGMVIAPKKTGWIWIYSGQMWPIFLRIPMGWMITILKTAMVKVAPVLNKLVTTGQNLLKKEATDMI